MFDLNGDGNVDADEFDKVTDLMKQHSSTGQYWVSKSWKVKYNVVCVVTLTYFITD